MPIFTPAQTLDADYLLGRRYELFGALVQVVGCESHELTIKQASNGQRVTLRAAVFGALITCGAVADA